MKYFRFLLIVIITILFTNCTDRDESCLKGNAVQDFYKSTNENIVRLSEKFRDNTSCILEKKVSINEKNDSISNIIKIFNYLTSIEYKIDKDIAIDWETKPTKKLNGRHIGLKEPINTVLDNNGDCEDKTALAVMLYEQIGVSTLIINNPNHVYLAIPYSYFQDNEKDIADKPFIIKYNHQKWIAIDTSTKDKVKIGNFNGETKIYIESYDEIKQKIFWSKIIHYMSKIFDN